MSNAGILTKNVEDGAPLAVVSSGDTYANILTVSQEVLLCPRNRGTIDLAHPYKSFTGGADSYDCTAFQLDLPYLLQDNPKLIDCRGASHVFLYNLLPLSVILEGLEQQQSFSCLVVGYTPYDADATSYVPVQSWSIQDIYFSNLAVSENSEMPVIFGFPSLSIDGVNYVSCPPIRIPTLGFSMIQIVSTPGDGELGNVGYTGSSKMYVTVT